ncbi:hypothetical protein ETB97_010901 [Aspergillus alliaceus]|uniref:Uncharacterized protein n=1 Tax=Petromyces alliaceus TaxID=209559 RepID=A0A8H6AA50_PETAA|nr:hypothetical protein ETB97_010901 [Aspergillus burnettii]
MCLLSDILLWWAYFAVRIGIISKYAGRVCCREPGNATSHHGNAKLGLPKSAEASTASASIPRTVDGKGADEAFEFIKRHDNDIDPLTPSALGKLKMKVIFCILRLLLARNLMLFIDKATLGYAVLLGLMEETHIVRDLHLTNGQAIILLYYTARDYSGLIPLRLFFGLVEATVIPALEMAMTMFFTPKDLHALQPVSWIACFGCPIPIGLLGYTLLFSKSPVRP